MARMNNISHSFAFFLVTFYGVISQPDESISPPAPPDLEIPIAPPAPAPVDIAESRVLEAKASTWIQNHPAGYVYRVSHSDGTGFVGAQTHRNDGSMTNKQMFTYSPDHQTHVNLGFKGDVNPGMSAADLQNALSFIAIDRLPVRDFEHPDNWDVFPNTPMSSFSEGVSIDRFDGRQIKLTVRTTAFAMTGTRNDMEYVADQGQPDGTFFQVRQEFPMEVSLDVPIHL